MTNFKKLEAFLLSHRLKPSLLIFLPQRPRFKSSVKSQNDHFISDYDCCDESLAKQPKCLNIDVGGDVFYGTINRTCMDFSRSNFHCATLTSSPWLEQFNEATSFLDCSQVYGSTKSRQMALRLHTDGLLATNNNMKDFLPTRQQLSRYSQGAGSDFESKDFWGEVEHRFWVGVSRL